MNNLRQEDFRADNVIHPIQNDDVVIVGNGEVPEPKASYTLDESGEGLGQFHRNAEELGSGNGSSKLLGGLVIALMVGAVGAYAYSMYTPQQEIVARDDLPRPSAPASTAAMTPPPAIQPVETPAPVETTGAPQAAAPAAPVVTPPAPPVTRQAAAPRPAPVTPAPTIAAPAPAPAPSPATVAPVQNQAAAVPEPVSPAPPASALAGNPPLNEQSAAPVEEAAPVIPAPAPAEASPQPDAAAPAQ